MVIVGLCIEMQIGVTAFEFFAHSISMIKLINFLTQKLQKSNGNITSVKHFV